jgi:hypothetical protein
MKSGSRNDFESLACKPNPLDLEGINLQCKRNVCNYVSRCNFWHGGWVLRPVTSCFLGTLPTIAFYLSPHLYAVTEDYMYHD